MNDVLPRSDTMEYLRDQILDACEKAGMSPMDTYGVASRMIKDFKKLDIRYSFYNSDYIRYLFDIYSDNSKVDGLTRHIPGTSSAAFQLAIFLKYMKYRPRSTNFMEKSIAWFEKYLVSSRYSTKFIDNLILQIRGLLFGSRSKGYYIFRDMENFYLTEHPYVFDQWCRDRELDFVMRRTKKYYLQYYKLRFYELEDFLKRGDQMFKTTLVNLQQRSRARRNIDSEMRRVAVEIKLYGVSPSERKLILKDVVR